MDENRMKHGGMSWNELITNDVEGAKAFYSKLFQWDLEDQNMDGAMAYTVIRANGEECGGIMHTPPGAEGMPPSWGMYITVDDVEETVKLAESLGGKILLPPTDIPEVGRFSVIQDPQGAYISVITYKMA